MTPRFTFPVYGHRDGMSETVAVFFDEWTAIDYALHPERDGFGKRNLYCAPAKERPLARAPLSELSNPEGWQHAA